MHRVRAGVIAGGGLAAAVLDVVLCFSLLGDVMRAEGSGFLAWAAALVLSGCFLAAAAIVLLHCAADWGWCWPGWGFGLLYLLLVAEELGDRSGEYGSSMPLVLVCSYLTTIPFQLAVWARRTVARPPRPGPERTPLQRPRTVQWPRTVKWPRTMQWPRTVRWSRTVRRLRTARWPRTARRVLVLLVLRSALLVLRAVRLVQQRRSAALAEERLSARGWNSVTNRR